jgi:threonine/homoserine/homoserine lactone efflux protein
LLVYLSQGLILGGTAAAQPGPLLAYLLSQTLNNGWKRTLPAAFAPLISDGPIVLLVILVLTHTPEWSLQLLRITGGLFLLYLAYGAYKSYRSAETATRQSVQSRHTGLLNAALMNLLSPNPYIFWATIAGPIVIAGWQRSPRTGLSFVLGFYFTLIGGFMAFITLFAITKRLDARLTRILSALSALALLIFAIYQLWLGVSQW